MSDPTMIQMPAASTPDPAAVVLGPQVRFSLLSPRLIRMEHSPSGQFEDRASQAFWHRRQPVPEYVVRLDGLVVPRDDPRLRSGGRIEIETPDLLLTYRPHRRGFTPAALSVHVKATGFTWRYGDGRGMTRNLGGTYRTLDGAAGHVEVEPGLMARSGAACVDDSASLVFNADGWLEARAHPENVDQYLFGHGHDYLGCLRDFGRVAGRTPLIPRYALGNWWSRYWAYSAEELLGLMEEFKAHQVPLSVCIVDMDWHLQGWTGYTWNRALFPDPPAFIARLHALGLKTALNLHPADGVGLHEEQHPDFVRAMGLEPGQPVPFDCADPQFMRAYFDLLHHPYEAQGVDFWWIDWQQGTRSRLPGLDPLWWLNHLHFHDLGRDGRRPFIFSRWGGLGNHRYPIGFSGDTLVGWEALGCQPGFTATAANVGYGWWSHDIGGHMGGIEDDELYARWVQYGVFSPILRLHCTNVPFHERRPWARGPAAGRAAAEAMRLRHRLIPYLYAMAWRNHVDSRPLIVPMYYSHPEVEAAYSAPQQYWFGSELLAAPFTRPADSTTGLSRQDIWLPPGEWFDYFTGECLAGGHWLSRYGGLEEIPVYARAGAIVALGSEAGWGGVANPQALDVYVFPGADNQFELYEDDGESQAYQQGKHAITRLSQRGSGEELRFEIAPVEGDRGLVPGRRAWSVHLRGVVPPGAVRVSVAGVERLVQTSYDPGSATLSMGPVELGPEENLVVSVAAPAQGLVERRDRRPEKLMACLWAFRLDTWVKDQLRRDWPRLCAGEVSLRSYHALSDAQVSVLISLLAG